MEQKRVANHSAGLGEKGLYAPVRSRRHVCPLPEHALRRLPLVAREAPGSPASLLYPRTNGGRSNAVVTTQVG